MNDYTGKRRRVDALYSDTSYEKWVSSYGLVTADSVRQLVVPVACAAYPSDNLFGESPLSANHQAICEFSRKQQYVREIRN